MPLDRALLELDGVSVAYGNVRAIDRVSLRVQRGEIVTLIGANGAGKSTTLKAISAVVPLTEGAVSLEGERIDHRPPHEIVIKGVCHAPEGRGIFPGMTVEENLSMGAYSRRGRHATEGFERVYSLFPVLRERRRQPGGTLSGGEQQMLAIGRALMAEPKVLLLDEPSMGLAPMLVQRIFSIIGDINAQGVAILLVEQNAHQALRAAHRGYVLETGRVVLSGDSESLLNDDNVRKAYLGEE